MGEMADESDYDYKLMVSKNDDAVNMSVEITTENTI
jgi:hypothetical protein